MKLLYVDDHMATREALAIILRASVERVIFASDGLEALHLYDEDVFDVVITDLHMPRMGGAELALLLKQKNPPPYIVAVSAASVELEAHKKLFDATLNKPIMPAQLMALIEKAR